MANHKFKVGDRLVVSGGGWFRRGTLVTVVAVCDGNNMPYLCDDGKSKLWVSEDDLAPASEADKRFEFRAGQRVRIRSWESMEKEFGVDSGGDIRALGAFTKGMRHLCGRSATISNIIGKHVVLKDWDDGSGDTGWCFSTDMLEPAGFEAGQIEEGIKKYDADHAEKKPGVKKVKRHAKAGEYVKIVNQCCNWGYQNGDILRVIKEWSGTSVICEGATVFVYDREYVVLEGYKPEPIKKHVYTAEQVERAKKLCGEMMVEAFDDNKTFAFHFYDKQNGGWSGDCEKNEVKADSKSFDGTEAVGIAKCSDHDEYNVWIGRCVALCKALHKSLPDYVR